MNDSSTYTPSVAAQISHELRIPLAGILGMLQFLNETSLTSEQKEYVDLILRSATRLLALESTLHALVRK